MSPTHHHLPRRTAPPWRRAAAGLLVAAWLLAAGGVAGAQSGGGSSDVITLAEAGMEAAARSLQPTPEGSTFLPASDAALPDQGDGIVILEASIVTLDPGRPLTGGDFVVDVDGVRTLATGLGDYAANFDKATAVMVRTDRPVAEGGHPVDNLSLSFAYPGKPTLGTSEFGNDPLLGASNVIDFGQVNGTELFTFQEVVDARWQPFANPVGQYELATDDGDVMAWLVPGLVEQVAIISSHAGEQFVETLYFSEATPVAPPELLDPATIEQLATLDDWVLTPAGEVIVPSDDQSPGDDGGASGDDDAPAPGDGAGSSGSGTGAEDDGGTSPLVPIGVGVGVVLLAAGGAAVVNNKKGACDEERKAVADAERALGIADEELQRARRHLAEVEEAQPAKPAEARPLGPWKAWNHWYENRYIPALNRVSNAAKIRNEAEDALDAARAALTRCEGKAQQAGEQASANPPGPPPTAPAGYTDFQIRTISGAEAGKIIVGAGVLTVEIKDPEGRSAMYTFTGVGPAAGLPFSGIGPTPWAPFTTTAPMFVHQFEGSGQFSNVGAYAGAGAGIGELVFYCGDLRSQTYDSSGGGTGVGAGSGWYYGWWELRD